MTERPPSLPWYREPLVHFCVLGAVVFVLHASISSPPSEPDTARANTPAAPTDGGDLQTITITQARIRALHTDAMARGQVLSAEQEAAILENIIDEEVLYREAVAIGLEQEDPIVRRRLVQKMGFLLEDMVAVDPPTDAALTAWLTAHPERYTMDATRSFQHVFMVTPSTQTPDAEAASLLDKVSSGTPPQKLGAPFIRGHRFEKQTRADTVAQFGESFANAIFAATASDTLWQGPLLSSYGWHLVQITKRTEARLPTLDQVRVAVRGDYEKDQAEARARTLLAEFRSKYDIVVEHKSAAP